MEGWSRIGRVLIDSDQLARRVAALGEEISRDYQGTDLLVMVVLHGAAIFGADLVRQIPLPLEIGFVAASSYSGTLSSGQVTVHQSPGQRVQGRHVLLVEDVLDTGLTLRTIHNALAADHPADLRACVLLSKDRPRMADIKPRYVGFHIPDDFVVGYGLDLDGRYRNLPHVGVLNAGEEKGRTGLPL